MTKETAIIIGMLNEIDSLMSAINDNFDKIPPNKYDNARAIIEMLDSIWRAGGEAGKEWEERFNTTFTAKVDE